MHRDIIPGTILLLKSGVTCLVIGEHVVKGAGVFYSVLVDGEDFVIDYSDIQEIL